MPHSFMMDTRRPSFGLVLLPAASLSVSFDRCCPTPVVTHACCCPVPVRSFGLAATFQAWFCEIMEERRFRDLASKVYFPLLMVGAALALSATSRAESLRNSLQDEREDLSTFQITIFIILLIITVVVLLLHFAEAWKVLPGAHLISGVGVPRVEVREDLLSIYMASRLLILAYFILYAAFSVARDDGWGYQLYLLAWVLSLFAQFKSFVSVFWLAVTTGVFLQGIGAYGIAFLCDERVQ
ncbi:unnamed protein product [Ectocarpus fasciculatus]